MERGDETVQSFGRYVLERQAELNLSDNEAAYLRGVCSGPVRTRRRPVLVSVSLRRLVTRWNSSESGRNWKV